MSLAGVAALLQLVALKSLLWFTASSGLSELRLGLRDSRVCDLFERCTSAGLPQAMPATSGWVYGLGLASALALIVAIFAQWFHDSDRLWKPTGFLSLLTLLLVLVLVAQGAGAQVVGLKVVSAHAGPAPLLAILGSGLGAYASLRSEWGDSAPRVVAPRGEMPKARVHRDDLSR